jgi:hypothetical protein
MNKNGAASGDAENAMETLPSAKLPLMDEVWVIAKILEIGRNGDRWGRSGYALGMMLHRVKHPGWTKVLSINALKRCTLRLNAAISRLSRSLAGSTLYFLGGGRSSQQNTNAHSSLD